MKRSEPSERSPQARSMPSQARVSIQHHSFVESILTDAVLKELKKQSTAACILCSLEEMDEEDWD